MSDDPRGTVETPPGPRLEPVPRPETFPPYESLGYRLKRLLLGRPLRTAEATHERIPKRVALAVFSSDPISSTAYATEEMLLVLVATGAAGMTLALPLAGGIALLLLVLVVSYRQVIRAYPRGGGAYMVSRDNLGGLWAMVCAAALLIDYVLTVAVSVSAGTAALASAIDPIGDWRVEISVAFIVVLAWVNLRGVKEAGKVFAVPTYVYIVSLGSVVVWGIFRTVVGGLGPIAYGAGEASRLVGAEQGTLAAVSLFLILHAFAAGTTALTGVEAIADGVPAFRPPEARNAQKTLVVMAVIMGSLFLGITFLAQRLQVHPFENGNPTLVAQIARYVLGGGSGTVVFVFVQVATLFILVLAANTAFNGFPVLASFAAQDALLPRQLRKRGHRLVYSNGVLLLSGAAVFLVIAFKASVHRLIPLYAIGVVTSFTLAQAGMTLRHLRQKEEGWRKGLAINGLGAAVTLVVLVVITITKLRAGAWMVVVAVPVIVWLLRRTRLAYHSEVSELKVEASERLAPPKPRHEVVILLEDLDRSAIGALQYARQLNPLHITAVHVAVDPDHARELARLWSKVHIPSVLEVVDAPDRNLLSAAQEVVAEFVQPDTEVTVLVPRRGYAKFWHRVLHDRSSAGLVKVLGNMDGVNVTIVPFRLGRRPLLAPSSLPPGGLGCACHASRAASAAPPQVRRSGGRGEELERDAVRVAEAHARAVARILDLTVRDAELVEPACPLLELSAVGTAEGDVVEADPELAEPLVGRGRRMLVQTDQHAIADQVHGVVEVGIGVLVQHWLGAEERFVPGNADGQVADGERNVGDGRKGGHVVAPARRDPDQGGDPVTAVRMSIPCEPVGGHDRDTVLAYQARLAKSAMLPEKSTEMNVSSSTVQASWPGGITYASPAPASPSEPSSITTFKCPETT